MTADIKHRGMELRLNNKLFTSLNSINEKNLHIAERFI